MNKIEIKGVTKVYKKETTALDNATVTFEANKIYGLLGRNGAGKTTLLNILTTKMLPLCGEITIDGEEVFENDKLLSKFFYIMVDSSIPWALHRTFKRMKDFYPDFDIEYANELAKRFEIDISKKSKTLSTGEFSLFKAILALASNAEILLLDEPVLGVDPNHREMLYKEMIKNYSEKPKTIIISTHLIKEVASIVEEVVIIKEGRIIRNESVESLLEKAYIVSGKVEDVDEYKKNREFISAQLIGERKTVTIVEDNQSKDVLLGKRLNLEFGSIELQELCMALTKDS